MKQVVVVDYRGEHEVAHEDESVESTEEGDVRGESDVSDYFLSAALSTPVTDVQELSLVRSLKSSDDVALPEDGHYYDRLHAKIMQALGEVERGPKGATSKPPATSTKKLVVAKKAVNQIKVRTKTKMV